LGNADVLGREVLTESVEKFAAAKVSMKSSAAAKKSLTKLAAAKVSIKSSAAAKKSLTKLVAPEYA